MMCELSKHDRSGSFWGPYLNTLPLAEEDAVDSPLDWPDEELNGSPSLMQLVQTLRARRAAARAWVEVELGLGDRLPRGCSGAGWRAGQSFAAAFNEAYALAMTRKAATLPLNVSAEGAGDAVSAAEESSEEVAANVVHEVMTPLLDLLNHRRVSGGRYTLLHSSRGAVLGVGMLAPSGKGLLAGEEVWHDYEGGRSAEGGDEGGCDLEVLAAYGFVPHADPRGGAAAEEVDGACALLPWEGTVRMRDARGGRVLGLCSGAVPVASSSGAQLSAALQWEIAHDLAAVEAILATSTAGEEAPEGSTERGECIADAETCAAARAIAAEAAAQAAKQRLRRQHRAALVRQVASGEAAVLRALHEACAAGQEISWDSDHGLSTRTGEKRKNERVSSGKKKRHPKRK